MVVTNEIMAAGTFRNDRGIKHFTALRRTSSAARRLLMASAISSSSISDMLSVLAGTNHLIKHCSELRSLRPFFRKPFSGGLTPPSFKLTVQE
jgi:hypothetical protein